MMAGLSGLVDQAGDLGILLGHALVGVDQDQADVRRAQWRAMERRLEYFSIGVIYLGFAAAFRRYR